MKKNYDYYESVKADVMEYIKFEIDYANFNSLEDLEDHLNDELWACDAVTGNASGSYTFCTATAKEYVTDNVDLLAEALEDFGTDAETITDKFLSEDWEYFDVTIRCYVLSACVSESMEEIEEDFDAAQDAFIADQEEDQEEAADPFAAA